MQDQNNLSTYTKAQNLLIDLFHNLRISAGLLKSFEDEERTLLDVNEHRSQETFEEDKERVGYGRGLIFGTAKK